jgi:prepilin-type N-terminal cleavage/methylation domain-containing protein
MRRRGGYTLIELVLVMLLLTFVAVSVFLLT